MELVHSALLLHEAGKEINEENVRKVAEAADLEPDEAKIKALVASLEGVDIDEELSKGAAVPAAGAPAEEAGKEEEEEKAEGEKEEEEVSEEEAAEGLGELF